MDRLHLSLTPFRLLFKHPFGTAHGVRDGTDAILVRLQRGPHSGYGEATLPPYVAETSSSVIDTLKLVDPQILDTFHIDHFETLFREEFWQIAPAARAAITTALLDLSAKESNTSLATLLGDGPVVPSRAVPMFTLGHCAVEHVAERVAALPIGTLLKVKLGGANDTGFLSEVIATCSRPLFLDANQGWSSLNDALGLLSRIPDDRAIGIEQPFAKDRWDLHRALRRETCIPVFGDESIQGLEDLSEAAGSFDGVNIKLMKCGGVDIALRMAQRARELDMQVMLGSMSESSLGCGAMCAVQAWSDLVDLDGPWLLSNDPFTGLELREGRLHTRPGSGIGTVPSHELNWIELSHN